MRLLSVVIATLLFTSLSLAQSICPLKISIQAENHKVQINALKSDQNIDVLVNDKATYGEWTAKPAEGGQPLAVVRVHLQETQTQIETLDITLNRVSGEVISVVYNWMDDIDFGYDSGSKNLLFTASSSCK